MCGHSADTEDKQVAEKITDKLAKELEAPERGNRITYDTDIKGFGLRVTAAGARSFILNYRNETGRERRYTIGTYPDWTVLAARTEAKELKKRIDRGEDPMGARHEARTALTVRDLTDRYAELHMPKKRPSSQAEDRAMIAKTILPRLGALKVVQVEHEDIQRLHHALKGTPYRANRIVALLSKMFSLAVKWKMREDNPAKGIERYAESTRKRYLSQQEIARLTAALSAYPGQTAANAIRLLLLTGARRGEALSATWDQFDLEVGIWTKLGSHTKQKTEHRIPLSAPALQLLSEMKATAKGEHVFPGRKPGGALAEINKAWNRIRTEADLADVRLHDLRHTYASILASGGISLPMIGALLGHTQPQTTARYVHLFDDPLREATERVGAAVTSAGKDGAEVVPLRHRGA